MIKKFAEILNENKSLDLDKYVKSKFKDKRVNFVTFEDVLIPLGEEIENYSYLNSFNAIGDLTYSQETVNLFKKLVDSMTKDHIDGAKKWEK